MTYSIEKPDAGPSPKIDVDQIRENFATYAPVFSTNHTAINDRNQGFHEDVILEQQSVTPSANRTYDVIFARSVNNATGTQPQLFVRLPTFLPTDFDTMGSGNSPMQLTYNTVNTSGPIYQSFWPGGYVVYTGQTTDITAPIVLTPTPSRIVVAIASSHTRNTGNTMPFNAATNILSSNSFKIDSTLNGSGPVIPYLFTWMAVAIQ